MRIRNNLRSFIFVFCTSVLSVVSLSCLSDVPSDSSTPVAKPTGGKVWNLRQADIHTVIEAVAKATGKNFIVDPRVRGNITLISEQPIDKDALYPLFLSVLDISGYSAIPAGSAIKIIPNQDAKATAASGYAQNDDKSSGDAVTTRVVPVKHVSSEQMVSVIRPLMPQWSNASAYGPSNMIILSGPVDSVERIADIIEQIDVSSQSGVDAIQLHHALSMDVVNTIKALVDSQKNRLYQRQTLITSDDKTNTVLVSGSPYERLRIRLLVNQLDKQSANMTGNTAVIYLKFLKAEDVVPILAGVAQANFSGNVGTVYGSISTNPLDTSPLTSDTQTTTASATVTEGNPNRTGIFSNNPSATQDSRYSNEKKEGNTKPNVQIMAEPNANAIIISAPQALMREFKTLIAKLDTRPRQILVEALIAEINEEDVNLLGLEWGMVTSDSDGNTFNPGLAIISSHTALSDFQSRLYGLVTQQKANILSTPSVVVLDNRQAKILIGQQVSIQESSYPNNASGGTVGSPYTTFSRQNVALHLYVRPQISEDKTLQLQIDQGNDTLANQNSVATGLPVVNTSHIQTSVLVNSGNILVLGGLIQNSRQKDDNKLPIVGDLPGLGELFKKRQHTKTKKLLMVFIRPTIISDPKEAVQVTNSKYFATRSQQLTTAREEPYDANYKDIVLPQMGKQPQLPKPFRTAKR